MRSISERLPVVCVALFVVLWLGAHVQAQRFGPAPITIRIEGFVGAKPTGLVTLASWIVLVQERKYKLHVTRLEVLRGNTSYFNIIEAVGPYPYAFTVYGNDQTLQAFTQAPPGQQIAIIANAQMAPLPGVLFLSSVDVVPPPTAAATTPRS